MRVTDPGGGWCQRHYRMWQRGKLDTPFSPALRELRRLRDEEGYSFPELSRRFGIHEQTARKAYRRTTWGHVDHDAPR